MPDAQVISCSRRTDIPRCYSGWLEEVLALGSVTFRAPRGAARHISLAPEDVHSMVLWSKDYAPLLQRPSLVKQLQRLNCYFHFTITGLGRTGWEPEIPPWSAALAQMTVLVRLFGARRVNWRFDPVVHWSSDDKRRSNLSLFPRIAAQVAELGVGSCTFSLVQLYRKNERRAQRSGLEITRLAGDEGLEAAAQLAEWSTGFGLGLYSCAEEAWLQVPGVSRASCVDAGLLNALRPDGMKASAAKDGSQRRQCGCSRSIDIGSYTQRCGAAQCLYCYAN